LSELARATAEVWLSIGQACALGIARSSLYWKIEHDQVVSRMTAEGAHEVLLASLPDRVQVRRASGRAPGVEGLPKTIDRRLAVQVAGARLPLVEQWEQLSRSDRDGPVGARILAEYGRAGTPLLDACSSIADAPQPSSLDRVARKVRELFEAGKNGAFATLGRVGMRRRIESDTLLPDDARAYLLRLWLEDGLRTKKRIERTYLVEAKRRGWPAVSYSTIRRVIDACPGPVAFLARRGLFEFRGKASPYISRDDTQLEPGSILNADHHELDFFCYDDDTGLLIRPWWTIFMDMASRFFQGWRICRTPSLESVKAAFAHAILPKRRPEYASACGLCKFVYFDNGKEFLAHDLEGRETTVAVGMLGHEEVAEIKGLFPILSIVDIHAEIKNAKAKPVERGIGTLATDFSQTMPGYCGRNAEEKPSERLKELVAQHKEWRAGKRRTTPFLPFSAVEQHVEEWIFEYHTRPHKTLSRGGRELSPADFYRLYAQPRELVDDRTLELLLMERQRCKVQKNGVLIRGLWYWSEELGDLYRPEGRKAEVEARLDPVEAGRAYVYTLNGAYICEAINAPILRTGSSGEELEKQQRVHRDYEKRQRRALKTMTERAPADAWTALQALHAKTPAELAEPIVPEGSIQRLVPGYDGVELRQKQPERGPVTALPNLFDLDSPSPRPTSNAQPKIRLFDCEDDDETPSSAAGGGGEP
jgi:hypothetical protein